MNNQEHEKQSISPSGFYFTYTLLRYKYFIIIMTILGTVASAVISFTLPDWYSSTINVVPPKNTSSLLQGALGNISSALKDIGITKMGSKTDAGYSFMVILDSRTVKDSLINRYKLWEEYDIPASRMTLVRDILESNLEIKLLPEGNYTITIWDQDREKAATMTRDYMVIVNDIALKLFRTEAGANKQQLERRVEQTTESFRLVSDSLQKFSKKYMLFSPEDQAKAFSMSLSDLKAEMIKQEINLELIKNRYGINDPATALQQKAVDELKSKIEASQNEPGFAGNFTIKNATGVGIEYLRLYTDLQMYAKVKTFLLPMLEEAKLDEIKESPTLFVLDDALVAEKKSRPKRSLIILGSFFGLFFISVLLVFGIENVRSFSGKYKEAINSIKVES
jgi:tyrosine-protein kinase Etk/Wzc